MKDDQNRELTRLRADGPESGPEAASETLGFHALDQYVTGRIRLDQPAGAAIPAPDIVFPAVVSKRRFFAGASPAPFSVQLVIDGKADQDGKYPSHVSVDCPAGRTVVMFDGTSVAAVPVYEVTPKDGKSSQGGTPRDEEFPTCVAKTEITDGDNLNIIARIVCAVYKKPEDKDEPIAALVFDETKGEPSLTGKWARAMTMERFPVADVMSNGLVRQYASGTHIIGTPSRSIPSCFDLDHVADGETGEDALTIINCAVKVGGTLKTFPDQTVGLPSSTRVLVVKISKEDHDAVITTEWFDSLSIVTEAANRDLMSAFIPLYRINKDGVVINDYRNMPQIGGFEF